MGDRDLEFGPAQRTSSTSIGDCSFPYHVKPFHNQQLLGRGSVESYHPYSVAGYEHSVFHSPSSDSQDVSVPVVFGGSIGPGVSGHDG